MAKRYEFTNEAWGVLFNIKAGSPTTSTNRRAVACVGDRISCEAVIGTGATDKLIEGQTAAREDDTSNHGVHWPSPPRLADRLMFQG